MEPRMQAAFTEMEALESGAVANPDEGRMVGHYWLRAPERAPSPDLRRAIEQTLADLEAFASGVHEGRIRPASRPRFTQSLVIGIGGSALGPQFVADALGGPGDPLQTWFFDNTDPGGIDRVLARIGDRLAETLTVVISKSGGTKETRNGMLEAREAYRGRGLELAKHAAGRDRRRQRARPARAARRIPRAFPDVGLGRRTHQ
jgi:glucose-6-phosphate isomerase